MGIKYRPRKKRKDYSTIMAVLAAILVILAVIGYILTLGKTKNKKLESLKSRHKRLLGLIEKKSDATKRVKKFNKRVYFWVRLLLSLVYLSINMVFYFFIVDKDLGVLLNFNQVGVIFMIILSFITFGNFKGLHIFILRLKMQIEIKTYKRFESENIRHKKELVQIEAEMEQLKNQKTIEG